MKIENIFSLEELWNVIEKDRCSERISDRRFPIRFIFLNTFEELKETIKYLRRNYNIDFKEVKELLPNEDSWLTKDEIIDWIKNMSNSTIVVSLSEFLRFQNKEDFYTTLKSLTEIEKQDNIRIYIPLVGLWARFEQEFWNNFYRREEWAPVWKLKSSSQKIVIYHLVFDLVPKDIFSEKQFTVINTTEQWLSLWKMNYSKKVVSLSKSLSYYYKNFLPDQIFDLKDISNQKELLEEVFGLRVPVRFLYNEAEFWDEFLKEVSRYNKKGLTIEYIFSNHFNIRNIEKLTSEEFVTLYLQSNSDYERWLIKTFFSTLSEYTSSYLYQCFKKIGNLKVETLIKRLWLEIFYLSSKDISKDLFYERKKLLNRIHRGLNFSTRIIEKELRDVLNTLESDSVKKTLEYLTDLTFAERKYLISKLRDKDIQDIQKLIPDLKEVYPALAYYLDWDSIVYDTKIPDWILEYFKNYNYSKLKHLKSTEIEELLNEKNKNKSTFSEWYYSIPKVKIEENVKYIWVDGLGAEWFPILVYLLKKYGAKIRKKLIVRVNLPSTTECNRYEFEKIAELDNYVHSQKKYNYPDILIEELEIVEKIVKKIIETHSNTRIGIISDHGFSFLCLKDFANIKRLDLSKAEHEGRCMLIDEQKYIDDEYFIVWNIDEGNCRGRKALVALKHFSLNNTPRREVHGGATPEEVLVPYIIIETGKDKIKYDVKLLDSEVWITNPILKFKIYPQPSQKPMAFLNRQPLNVFYDKENEVYGITLKDLKVGVYTIILKIYDTEHPIRITIKGGFKERDLL